MKIFRTILAVLLLLTGWILIRPLKLRNLSSKPEPVTDYAAALERIAALQAADTPDINPLCRLQLLTHGRRVERVVVFWHGYTNCPQQFLQLGRIFFERGDNVLIPRLPQHGQMDRLSPAQTRLTAETMIAQVDEALNLAHGLGERVTVVGFSAGGVLAGWAAQQRADLEQAVIICPSFALKIVPLWLSAPFARLLLTWPNFYRWWDAQLKTEASGPQYAYPRYSSRALGQILRLGLAVRAAARRTEPATSSILVITNPNDWAVNNDFTAEIVSHWRNNGSGNIGTYEFDIEHRLGHDIIDPHQVAQRVELVYPILVDLIHRLEW
ncbi:MAG: alpha/beta fold hydrolase [Chloroflexota bacterium]